MYWRSVVLAAMMLCPSLAMAQQAIMVDRVGIGGLAPNTTSAVVIDPADIPARSAAQDVLSLDWSGNMRKGALAKTDLPGTVVHTDQANTFGAFTQTFGGALAGTSATFSSTLGVTGLSTLTGGALLPNGTAATPALRFSGDTNTGLYWVSSDVVGISAGGAVRAKFGSSAASISVATTLSSTLAVTGAATMSSTLGVTGLSTLTGGGAFGGTARSTSWTSGTTGWGVTTGGVADFRSVFADEGHYKTFISDLSEAHNGGSVWVKSAATVVSMTCPALGGTATLRVADFPSAANARVFSASDHVVMFSATRTDGDNDGATDLTYAYCVGVVSAYADGSGGNEGTQTWTFTRGSGANGGGMAASTVIAADSLALDYGVSGQGYAEVSANDGSSEGVNAPYFQTGRWTTSPIPANRTVTTRLGNLVGITGTAGYGLFAGPNYAATNGQYLLASDAGVDIHGARLRLWEGSNPTIELNPNSGNPYISVGNPAPTSYSSGNGFWCGDDGGTYKCRVGNPAGNRWTWDGSTMSVVGNGSGLTSINGGNIQTNTITASQIAAGAITAEKLSVTVAGPNMLPNASFEAASGSGLPVCAVYDNGTGTITSSGRTTSTSFDGAASWETTWSGTNNTQKGVTCGNGSPNAVTPAWTVGQTYVVSFYARAASAVATGMRLHWNVAPSTTVTLLNPNLTTTWQRYAYRITMGDSVENYGRFFISIDANFATPHAANTIYIDAISVTRGEVLGGYAPYVGEILPGTLYADRLIAGTISGWTINSSSFNVPGALSIDGTNGLRFAAASGQGDYPRAVSWAGGDQMYSSGSGLTLHSETGKLVLRANELFSTTEVKIGEFGSAAEVEIGSNDPITYFSPDADEAGALGRSGRRWKYPFFTLNSMTTPVYLVGGDDTSGQIKYWAGWSGTRTVRNGPGTASCTLVYTIGVLTGGTC